MNQEACGNLKYCGVPNFSSPYRRACFQPPFTTPCSQDNVNCMNTYGIRGSCYYDAACNSGNCQNGQCAPFESRNAKVISQLSNADYQRYLSSTGNTSAGTTAVCSNPMLLVEMNDKHNKGKREVLCPVDIPQNTSLNCKYALQKVWQCDRYKDTGDRYAYNAFSLCKDFEDCFVYDTAFPNGELQPVSVKMNNKCLGAAQAALRQSAMQCTSCSLPSCS